MGSGGIVNLTTEGRIEPSKASISCAHDVLVWSKNGSVANSIFEGIERFNLHIFQTGIANFTGVF